MIFIAVDRRTGQTIASGNSAAEAFQLATNAGYNPQDFTVVPISPGPRI